MLAATGDAYPPAANPKIKPIVFWGAWLYFAPSVVAAIWLTATFSESPAAFAPAALYGVLSVWALWSVSKRYFAKPPNTPPSGEGDH